MPLGKIAQRTRTLSLNKFYTMKNISCPKCSWKPNANDVWQCTCKHTWHTFKTIGQCPSCKKIWLHTQCHSIPGCGQWSPHLDWYHDLNEALSSQIEELHIQTAAQYQLNANCLEQQHQHINAWRQKGIR